MLEPAVWLRTLIIEHRSLEYIIVFFGAVFGGEVGLFTLGFLTAQKIVSTVPVIIFSFLGALAPNILWFIIGSTSTASRVVLHRYADTTTSVITDAVRKISRNNHFIALTLIKFLIGTSFLLMMYVSKTNIRFKKFILYESGAIFLSMLVIFPIGFLSGLGFTYVALLFNNLYIAVGFILLIIIIIVVVQLSIKKLFTKVS